MAYIKIDKQNLYHNLSQLALKAGSIDKIAIVLKDNAYGHGLDIIASLCKQFGIKQAVVMSNKEKNIVKSYFEHILVLNDSPLDEIGTSYAIGDMQTLKSINNKASIELKVDTGMHRNGITINQLDEALSIVKMNNLHLTGIMTHYRSADIMSSELFWQQKNFEKIKQEVRKSGFTKIRFHSHNSATLIRSNSFNEDIARCGIGAYGYSELSSTYTNLYLQPVLSLWATRVSTKTINKGERIGYGGCYQAKRNIEVSTYDIGYGDGWPRGDCNEPYIIPDGLSILGKVSMDFVSLESKNSEICIMNNAQKASRQFKTISYEMTVMLSKDIYRIII